MDIVEARKSVVIINNHLLNVDNTLDEKMLSTMRQMVELIKENVLDNMSDIFESNLIIDANIYKLIAEKLSSEEIYKILKSNKLRNILSFKVIKIFWNFLNDKDKVAYFKNTNYIAERDNCLLKELLEKRIIYLEDVKDKIEKFSLDISINKDWKLENWIEIVTPNNIVNYLNKNHYKFNNLDNILTTKILNAIPDNSLLFNIANKKMFKKINYKYLVDNWDAYDLEEIYKKGKCLNALNALYFKDKNSFKRIINQDFKTLDDYSLQVNAFDLLKNKSEFRLNPLLFCKFREDIAVNIICEYYENDLVDLLRNDNFVNYVSSELLTKLVNNLHFKSIFNLLQNDLIYNKSSLLSFNIGIEDRALVVGFLDSIKLCQKLNKDMFIKLLTGLEKDEVIKYLTKPYILNNLDDEDLVNILVIKNIKLYTLLPNNLIQGRLSKKLVIDYINKMWEINVDLDLIKNKCLLETALDLSDEEYNRINFDDVFYLFMTIYNKEKLALNISKVSFWSFKSVLTTYILLGLNNAVKIIFDGVKSISWEELQEVKNLFIEMKKKRFYENDGIYLKNISSTVFEVLDNYQIPLSEENLKDVSLNKVFSFFKLFDVNVLKAFNRYIDYKNVDLFTAKKELNLFIEENISNCENMLNKKYEKEFILKIRKFLKIKDNIYKEKTSNFNNSFLSNIKYNLLYLLLDDKNNGQAFLKNNINKEKLINKLKKGLGKIDLEEFKENILKPLSRNSFSIEKYLDNKGIKKPANYWEFERINNAKLNIAKLNLLFNKLSYRYNNYEINEAANYLLYENKTISKKKVKVLKKCKDILNTIEFEVYYNKESNEFYLNNLINSYVNTECDDYYNEVLNIENNISFCKKLLKKYFNNSVIFNTYYNHINELDYLDLIDSLTLNDFELKESIFNLDDLEYLFAGWNIKEIINFTDEDINILIDHNYMALGFMRAYPFDTGNLFKLFSTFKSYIKENKINLNTIKMNNFIAIFENLSQEDLLNTLINWNNTNYLEEINKNNILEYYRSYLKNNGYLIGNKYYYQENISIESLFGIKLLKSLFNDHNFMKSINTNELLLNLKKNNFNYWEIKEDNNYIGFIVTKIVGNCLLIDNIYLKNSFRYYDVINVLIKKMLKDNTYIDYCFVQGKSNQFSINFDNKKYYLAFGKTQFNYKNCCSEYYGDNVNLLNKCYEIYPKYLNNQIFNLVKLNYAYNFENNIIDFSCIKDFKGFKKIVFDNYNVLIVKEKGILLKDNNLNSLFDNILKNYGK